MNPIFEDISTATHHYPDYNSYQNRSDAEEPQITLHEGRKYEAVGESYDENISFGKRLFHIVAVISMVAAGIFLVFIPFLSKGYREELSNQLKMISGVVIHHIPFKPRHWQEHILHNINFFITSKIEKYRDPEIWKSPNAVAFCIKVAFEGGEVKKNYILKDTALDGLRDTWLAESKKIKNSLKQLLQEEINLESKNITCDYAILFKVENGNLISFSEHQKAKPAGNLVDECGKKQIFTEFDKIDSAVLDKMGLAGECVDSEGNFIEGKYFQRV